MACRIAEFGSNSEPALRATMLAPGATPTIRM
jgi:hypothetical protein